MNSITIASAVNDENNYRKCNMLTLPKNIVLSEVLNKPLEGSW